MEKDSLCVVLKVYDIKKSQQSDLYFAGSFCLVYQAKLTNSKRYILHICDFSRCRLNVSLPVHIQTAATKVTNIGAMTLFGNVNFACSKLLFNQSTDFFGRFTMIHRIDMHIMHPLFCQIINLSCCIFNSSLSHIRRILPVSCD